ncbi:MAG: tryptophan-rich sensory protein [Caldilinea sp. CFX5]|nr:tryptophan-rich sensory protein [Caldilinea sp. CFX5]
MITQEQSNAVRTAQRRKQWPTLLLALIIPFTAATIGGVATNRSLFGWYRRLRKPTWNPPAWVFGPVWTALYLVMGIASWLVWRRGELSVEEETAQDRHATHAEVQGALTFYGLQLVLNSLWSVIFFGLRRIDLALVEVVALWTMLLVTLTRFYRIQPLAGLLLVPYQLWVTFAALLNLRVWQLNRNRFRSSVGAWLLTRVDNWVAAQRKGW